MAQILRILGAGLFVLRGGGVLYVGLCNKPEAQLCGGVQ